MRVIEQHSSGFNVHIDGVVYTLRERPNGGLEITLLTIGKSIQIVPNPGNSIEIAPYEVKPSDTKKQPPVFYRDTPEGLECLFEPTERVLDCVEGIVKTKLMTDDGKHPLLMQLWWFLTRYSPYQPGQPLPSRECGHLSIQNGDSSTSSIPMGAMECWKCDNYGLQSHTAGPVTLVKFRNLMMGAPEYYEFAKTLFPTQVRPPKYLCRATGVPSD